MTPVDAGKGEWSLAGTVCLRPEISVPPQLLELCWGIIEEVQKHYPASGNFADDMKLACSQLKLILEASQPLPKAPSP